MKRRENKRFLDRGIRGRELKEDKLNTKYQINYSKNSHIFGTITKQFSISVFNRAVLTFWNKIGRKY